MHKSVYIDLHSIWRYIFKYILNVLLNTFYTIYIFLNLVIYVSSS